MKTSVDRGPWITTISGRPFHYLDIDPEVIQPMVIAHALSNICRFTGHVDEFYSVAQHCVIVSHAVPQEGDGHAGYAMEGLLHDAAEAFVGDVNRPLKELLGDAYRDIEHAVELVIGQRFGVQLYPMHAPVKEADYVVFRTEVRDLTPQTYRYPHEMAREPLPERILPWNPHVARREWLKRYMELGGV